MLKTVNLSKWLLVYISSIHMQSIFFSRIKNIGDNVLISNINAWVFPDIRR